MGTDERRSPLQLVVTPGGQLRAEHVREVPVALHVRRVAHEQRVPGDVLERARMRAP